MYTYDFVLFTDKVLLLTTFRHSGWYRGLVIDVHFKQYLMFPPCILADVPLAVRVPAAVRHGDWRPEDGGGAQEGCVQVPEVCGSEGDGGGRRKHQGHVPQTQVRECSC